MIKLRLLSPSLRHSCTRTTTPLISTSTHAHSHTLAHTCFFCFHFTSSVSVISIVSILLFFFSICQWFLFYTTCHFYFQSTCASGALYVFESPTHVSFISSDICPPFSDKIKSMTQFAPRKFFCYCFCVYGGEPHVFTLGNTCPPTF